MHGLKRFAAALGIGAAQIRIALDRPGWSGEEEVRGVVCLRGGMVEQVVGSLGVRLLECWGGGKSRQVFERRSITLATRVPARPGEETGFPFAVRLDRGADLAHEWHVQAFAYLPWFTSRSAGTRFNLLPPGWVRQLAAALRAAAPLNLAKITNRGTTFMIDLRPHWQAFAHLDAVRVSADRTGARITGVLEVNCQEASFRDLFRSLAGQDRIRLPLDFPADQLAPGPAGFLPDDLVQQLEELLTPFTSEHPSEVVPADNPPGRGDEVSPSG
jgi:hypothetical protein